VWFREFWGELSEPKDANVIVFVKGRQFNDEHCERGVAVKGDGTDCLTADQSRELARLRAQADTRRDRGCRAGAQDRKSGTMGATVFQRDGIGSELTTLRKPKLQHPQGVIMTDDERIRRTGVASHH
jgi:hypothetical protein